MASISTSAPAPPRRSLRRELKRDWTAYVFVSPGLILFGIFTAFALLFAFYLSFHEWSIIERDKPFVGLQNYRDIIHDERFQRAIVNTFYYTGASVPVGLVLGLAVALLLNQPIRFRGFFRTVYYLPAITPFVVVSILFKWFYNADYGLFNYYLLKLHVIDQPLLWLADKNLAMPSVILMSVWGGIAGSMVIYLAGLQAIPEELYEAAKVDGAGPFRRFWYITIPQLAPTTLFLLVVGIIYSLQVFTQIFVMTSGGPVDRTTTMVYYIYLSAFKFYEMGYATALAFFMFAMVLAFTLFQLRLYKRYGAAGF